MENKSMHEQPPVTSVGFSVWVGPENAGDFV